MRPKDPKIRVAERYMFSMSNLVPKRTGVPGVIIWVSAGEFAGADGQHGPRVKVAVGARLNSENLATAVSVTILDDPPKLIQGKLPAAKLRKVQDFIVMNRDLLIDYWRMSIDTGTLLDDLVPVK